MLRGVASVFAYMLSSLREALHANRLFPVRRSDPLKPWISIISGVLLSCFHALIFCNLNILWKNQTSSTYGHSQLKTGHPVRSAIHKQLNGRLVLRWVTTWESLL
ncbi:hypothetical protein KCU99_g8731, partial [Aureobasidium melanogenum]